MARFGGSNGKRSEEMEGDKMGSGVNFTNVLRAAFTLADSESTKKAAQLDSLFCAFGVWGHKSCS